MALPIAAKADIVTFDVHGTLDYTRNVSGTFLIDTATGAFLSSDLQYQGMDFGFEAAGAQEGHNPDRPLGYVILLNAKDSSASFSIFLPQYSLVGYGGGDICHNWSSDLSFLESTCPAGTFFSSFDSEQSDEFWTSGFLTPAVSTTPEPSSLVLLGTAALGLLGIGRKLGNQS